MNTPGSARLGSCQVSTVVEDPRDATRANALEGCTHTHTQKVENEERLGIGGDGALWGLSLALN